MLAIRIQRFGTPEVIELQDIARPVPGDAEVLIRVAAAGVGPWDAWVRSGKSVLDQPLPLTLGSDVAGRIEAVGAQVKGFTVGQAVFGVTGERFTGGYAEYALAPAGCVAVKPKRLSFVEAASVPVVAVTAQQMLFEHARLRAGERVLIHGAGGNVGAYALQLAKAARAEVVGTDVGPGVDYARSLSAGPVLDVQSSDFASGLAPFDVVIDTVGGDVQRRSFALLKPRGRLISSVSRPDAEQAAKLGVEASFMLVHVTTAELSRLAELLDAGALVTRVGAVLALDEARAAHEMLDGKRPRPAGKIVLQVAELDG
ncbi:MAG TPA: NADP-dependent oxidoreductase [Polyangiaceae bacterium]|nr:NADP-dependent oxidoreductase [Polyangiaceae bacterium]